jgi:hypothetical protein
MKKAHKAPVKRARAPRKKKLVEFTLTDEQRQLAVATANRVVSGEITRDYAQKFLTESGIPVLKMKGWTPPTPAQKVDHA